MRCFIIFCLFSIFYSTEVVIPLSSETYDGLKVNLVFHSLFSESHTPAYQLPLSIGSYVSWINEDLIKDPSSFVQREKNVQGSFKGVILTGYTGQTTAGFEKTNVIFKNFPFIFITKMDKKLEKENAFGLSIDSIVLLYLQNHYSIHQFLVDYERKQLLFSNEFDKNQYSSFFTKSCFAQGLEEGVGFINWGCKLSSVVINEKEIYKTNSEGKTEKIVYQEENVVFNSTQNCVFLSYEYHIMAPTEFLTLIEKEVFANLNDCFSDLLEQRKAFFCRKEISHSPFQSISFIFDNFEIKIPFQKLFYKFDDFYVFSIVESSTTWALGLSFLKHQPMMFDNKLKSVTFLSKEKNFYNVKFIPGKAPEGAKTQIYFILSNTLILASFTVILMQQRKYLPSSNN